MSRSSGDFHVAAISADTADLVLVTFVRRSLRESDAAAMAGLLCVAADWHVDEQRLRKSFADSCHDYERGSIGIFDGRALAGYGVLMLRGPEVVRHEAVVHPRYRGQGLGGELLAWADGAAGPLHASRFGGGPVAVLRSGCDSGNDAAMRLHQACGYRLARVFWSMTRNLADAVEDAPLAHGLRVAGLTAELAADALLVRNEAFREHWGSAQVSAEQWTQQVATAELGFVVYQGAAPLGALLGWRRGNDLYIGMVATRDEGRGRGIATALLARAMSQAQAGGIATASLEVDSDSLTGAIDVYERSGFTVKSSWTIHEKPLLPTWPAPVHRLKSPAAWD